MKSIPFLFLASAMLLSLPRAGAETIAYTGDNEIILGPDSPLTISIDLDQRFSFDHTQDSGLGHFVRFDTVMGPILVKLRHDPEVATTVENFLRYLDKGVFEESIFHRRVGGVLQGGAYRRAPPGAGYLLDWISPQFEPIPTQYHIPNQRGTLAMALRINPVTGKTEPDSATVSWFFNVHDNSDRFSPNGNVSDQGYAVFGEVVDEASLAVLDALYDTPTYTDKDEVFDHIPLLRDEIAEDTLLWVHSIQRTLRFTVHGGSGWWGWDAYGVALRHLNVDDLHLYFLPGRGGEQTISITAQSGTRATRTETMVYRYDPKISGYLSYSLMADQALGVWWSRWLGYYWPGHWPYLFIYGINWVYVIPSVPENYWFYHYHGKEWLWVHPNYYPLVYQATGANPGWIHIITGARLEQ